MKLVPLGDRVVLKQSAKEETTKSGIILAAKAQERPENAEVIAVGSPDRGTGGLLGGKYFFPAGLLYKEQTHGDQRSL